MYELTSISSLPDSGLQHSSLISIPPPANSLGPSEMLGLLERPHRIGNYGLPPARPGGHHAGNSNSKSGTINGGRSVERILAEALQARSSQSLLFPTSFPA